MDPFSSMKESSTMDLFYGLNEIPNLLAKFKDNDYINEELHDELVLLIKGFVHVDPDKNDILTLIKPIQRPLDSMLYKSCLLEIKKKSCPVKNELRLYCNWLALGYIVCYSDMEPSVENLTEAIEGVGPISHMVTEWRHSGLSDTVLTNEMTYYLGFERAVLKNFLEGPSLALEEITNEAFEKYAQEATFVCGFILIDLLSDQDEFRFLKPKVTEKLINFNSNPIKYHITACLRLNIILQHIQDLPENNKTVPHDVLTKVQREYKKGLEVTHSAELSRLYMQTVDELKNKMDPFHNGSTYRALWIKARIDVQKFDLLSLEDTLNLLNVLTYQHASFSSVVSEGLQDYPKSAELWCKSLFSQVMSSDRFIDSMLLTFQNATQALSDQPPEERLKVYLMFIDILTAKHSLLPNFVFVSGIKSDPELAKLLLLPFLLWRLSVLGVDQTRIILNRPYVQYAPLSFFMKFLEMEIDRPSQNVRAIRSCFERALEFFGTEESLWEQYVNFEFELPEKDRVKEIYIRAKTALGPKGKSFMFDLYNTSSDFKNLLT